MKRSEPEVDNELQTLNMSQKQSSKYGTEKDGAETAYTSLYDDDGAQTATTSIYDGNSAPPTAPILIDGVAYHTDEKVIEGTETAITPYYDGGLVGDGSVQGDGNMGTIAENAEESEKKSPLKKEASKSSSEEVIVTTKSSKVDGKKFKCLVSLIVIWFTFLVCFSLIAGVYYVIASTNIAGISDTRNMTSHILQQIQQFRHEFLTNTSALNNQTAQDLFDALQQQLGAMQSDVQQDQQVFTRIASIGQSEEFAINSCGDLPSYFPSGTYYIRTTDGSTIRRYCNMSLSCNGVHGGWANVVDLDFGHQFGSGTSAMCPSSLRPLVTSKVRGCIKPSIVGCTPVILETSNLEYSRVCGRITAYQIGHVDGFIVSEQNPSIDSNYVDGISLTYGSPRQHIWTFAAERDNIIDTRQRRCGCLEGNTVTPGIPSFVGENYFCETASDAESIANGQVFENDPLWDGAGCTGINRCCSFNNPPFFYTTLPRPTSDNIEMRVCTDEIGSHENIAVRTIELFVR